MSRRVIYKHAYRCPGGAKKEKKERKTCTIARTRVSKAKMKEETCLRLLVGAFRDLGVPEMADGWGKVSDAVAGVEKGGCIMRGVENGWLRVEMGRNGQVRVRSRMAWRLAVVGLRSSTCVGLCWSLLAVAGLRWSSLVLVGLRWPDEHY